jgi:hypothetical protein
MSFIVNRKGETLPVFVAEPNSCPDENRNFKFSAKQKELNLIVFLKTESFDERGREFIPKAR